jgi:protoheme IX farnesyltransferase
LNRVKTSALAKSFDQSWISDVGILVKFKLTLFVVITSVLAYMIGVGASINLTQLMLLTFGGFLVAGASNALNQVIEKDFDILMERTKNRPIAAGRMTMSQGVIIAGVMLIIGTVMLSLINPLTGLLGMISVVSYAFVYTPMKRFSTWAVPVGAIPGAMPALIGCVAAQGELTSLAVLLFAIQFMWQFPHFWSIAYLSYEDYSKAGYKFLPASNSQLDDKLGLYALVYAVLLLILVVPSVQSGLIDWLGALLLTAVSIHYVFASYKFYKDMTRDTALKLMFGSFIYLPIALGAFLISAL